MDGMTSEDFRNAGVVYYGSCAYSAEEWAEREGFERREKARAPKLVWTVVGAYPGQDAGDHWATFLKIGNAEAYVAKTEAEVPGLKLTIIRDKAHPGETFADAEWEGEGQPMTSNDLVYYRVRGQLMTTFVALPRGAGVVHVNPTHVSAVEPYDTDKEGKALLYLAGGKALRIDLPAEQVALRLMGLVEVK